ncbi:hypothetical protein ACPPVQ_12340 [Diaminobutyricibacter sp. McL0618]|uniref:hypothetical protein n=1 Tax=Leifsonia sp. McL0618 TaxID=3415677 RepID=UPI003CECBFDC
MTRKDHHKDGEYEWDGEPLQDGDDIVRDYEDGQTDTEDEREQTAYNIALNASGGGFVNDEKFDDGGFNAQNNP